MTRVEDSTSAQQAARADEQRRTEKQDQQKRTDAAAFQRTMQQQKAAVSKQQVVQKGTGGAGSQAQNMLLAKHGIAANKLASQLQQTGQQSASRTRTDETSRKEQHKDTEKAQNQKDSKVDAQRLDAQDDRLSAIHGDKRRANQDMSDMSGGGGGGSQLDQGEVAGMPAEALGAAHGMQQTASAQQAQGANAPRIPPQIIKEIVERVFVGVNQEGLKEMRIDLKGDMFGGTSIAISNDGGKITAKFETDDVNVGRLLKASEGELSRAFAHKGLQLERLDVAQR